MSNEEHHTPLVSCIMPTYNRRAFVPQAIYYFLRQDYPNKELIIVDDGTDEVSDLVPQDECIRYIQTPGRQIIGLKRNIACEQARGTIIAHWDDDDWHAPYQLRYQVEALLRKGADLCGITTLLFYDICTRDAWKYVYPARHRPWVAGSTLCYTRELWQNNPFMGVRGEDNHFVWSSYPKRLTVLSNSTFHIGIIHQHNNGPKRTSGPLWQPYDVAEIQRFMGDDWSFYRIDNFPQL